MASGVSAISDATFDAEVLQASQELVLAYWWASWCGPCRLIAPIMEQIAQQYGDRLKVVKLEVDPNPETVARYKVEGVPALRLFKAGEVIESIEGAMSRQKLIQLLDPYLGATVS